MADGEKTSPLTVAGPCRIHTGFPNTLDRGAYLTASSKRCQSGSSREIGQFQNKFIGFKFPLTTGNCQLITAFVKGFEKEQGKIFTPGNKKLNFLCGNNLKKNFLGGKNARKKKNFHDENYFGPKAKINLTKTKKDLKEVKQVNFFENLNIP